MTAARYLPAVLAVELELPLRTHDGAPARCSARGCGAACQGTLRGVGRWVPLDGDEGPYAYQEGPVLCERCHDRRWGAYYGRCAARRALWAVRPLGAGRTVRVCEGEQLKLWAKP